MYYEKFYPFYMTYANPMLFDGENMQEREFALMKSYYPKTAQIIQEKVEEECALQDYEGSRLYDEYPDKFMLHHLCRHILEEVQPELTGQEMPGSVLEEFVQVLLCQEISRRRCRRCRCRKYF